MQGMRISFRLPWGMPEKPVPPYAEWRTGTKLCKGYKKFFKHVAPYMDFMKKELLNQRPPANVMDWAKQQQHEY